MVHIYLFLTLIESHQLVKVEVDAWDKFIWNNLFQLMVNYDVVGPELILPRTFLISEAFLF